MPSSVKDMLAAAEAVVPRVTQSEAARLISERNALVVDLRETSELGGGR
ncbi:hypothetical protein [Roseomonas xinghualingensis]|nr:hypothetical protein [Roseomonas sp. SXEYE001]MCV4210016.1 hypothetical protein [Roseomonas sp. SXEYE001]